MFKIFEISEFLTLMTSTFNNFSSATANSHATFFARKKGDEN